MKGEAAAYLLVAPMKSRRSDASCAMPSICTRNSVLMRRLDSTSDSVREVSSESISSTNITAKYPRKMIEFVPCARTWLFPPRDRKESLHQLLALTDLSRTR